jgi:hypothetical protein
MKYLTLTLTEENITRSGGETTSLRLSVTIPDLELSLNKMVIPTLLLRHYQALSKDFDAAKEKYFNFEDEGEDDE